MRKRKLYIVAIMLCLFLSACSPPVTGPAEPTPVPERTIKDRSDKPIVEKDLLVRISDEEFAIGDQALALVETLGHAHEKRERKDKNGAVQSTTYFYEALTITTVPIDGKEYLQEVVFTNDSFATRRGICVGDSLEDLKRAYGEGKVDENWVIYALPNEQPGPDQAQLYFELDDSQYILLIGYQKAMAAR